MKQLILSAIFLGILAFSSTTMAQEVTKDIESDINNRLEIIFDEDQNIRIKYEILPFTNLGCTLQSLKKLEIRWVILTHLIKN